MYLNTVGEQEVRSLSLSNYNVGKWSMKIVCLLKKVVDMK